MMNPLRDKFAAQLYTLREELKADFPGVLRQLKSMGWNAVQIDGLKGYRVQEIANVIKETGLKTAGMHVSLDRMNWEPDVVLVEAELLNTKDLICHSLPEESRNAAGFIQAREDLRKFASKVSKLGYRVGYHNHDFEFHTKFGDQFAMHYMLDDFENHPIHPEFDTYWLKKAEQDPLQFIETFAGRITILHFKDMTNDERETFAEVGTGTIDFEPILAWGEKNRVDFYAVEQDYCPGNPFDSLAISLENLIKMSEAF